MSDKRMKMQDPRKQYPQPPFKPQHQGCAGACEEDGPGAGQRRDELHR